MRITVDFVAYNQCKMQVKENSSACLLEGSEFTVLAVHRREERSLRVSCCNKGEVCTGSCLIRNSISVLAEQDE